MQKIKENSGVSRLNNQICGFKSKRPLGEPNVPSLKGRV